MAVWRKASRRPRACPACDGPLDPALAGTDDPTCPLCGESLVPVRVAGMFRRLAAGLVDAALLAVTAGLLNWGLLAMLDRPPLLGGAQGLAALVQLTEISLVDVLGRITPLLVMAALYFTVFWAATGQTPGQRLLRVRVVDHGGTKPSALWAALRAVVKLAGLLPAALGIVWVAFDREKRGWHDHIAGTFVVRDSVRDA